MKRKKVVKHYTYSGPHKGKVGTICGKIVPESQSTRAGSSVTCSRCRKSM